MKAASTNAQPNDIWWPQFYGIMPRRPWSLWNLDGQELRDASGHSIDFKTGEDAIKLAEKLHLRLLTSR